jgi:hypothetical protein
MKAFRLFALAIVAIMLLSQSSRSADHIDSPITKADPAADITDAFAWMSPDANTVFLVMSLVRNATTASKFSDGVQYVFHTTSQPRFGATPSAEVAIICTFNAAQTIQCWAGNEAYVTGDASNVNGITSADGKLRVFAGLRNDAFFFNLPGFRATARIVASARAGALGAIPSDAAGCPMLPAAAVTTLVTQLQTRAADPNNPGQFLGANNGRSLNDFDAFNVLAIVIAVDKSIITKNGQIIGVWTSTNRP